MITSTIQDFALSATSILRHGSTVYGGSRCVTWTGDGTRHATPVLRYRELLAAQEPGAGELEVQKVSI